MRARRQGFTLIELLIVIVIIGILAAILIPNFLDTLQKAKQKRTMADIRLIGGAMFSWLTDESQAAAAGATINVGAYGPVLSHAAISSLLVSQYIEEVPVLDGWKRPLEYYVNSADLNAPNVILLRSAGKNGIFDAQVYDVAGFEPTDYEQDVVWADGFFVRYPQKTSP